jgi:radical SAM superfamily enzyme YgiQ (UPF0313 family)
LRITFIESTRYLNTGRLLKAKTLIFPSLTFPLLAALTPPGVEMSIVNEIFDEVDFDRPTDLVALTAITTNVYRAYEIADEYRRRGVPVVMGGIHASMEPEEAAGHADTVIAGEAEDTWPQFLEDFRLGRARRYYRPERPPSLVGLPVPRWDLVNKDRYLLFKAFARLGMDGAYSVQTSRGCNFSCDYCATRRFQGGAGYRPRPVEEVVAELRAVGARRAFFVDDNIFASPARAKELFRALIPLKIRWFGQGVLCAADDPELVDLCQRSGCRFLIAGLESINPDVLRAVGGRNDKVGSYERNIRAFRKAGIDLEISMMFGFDVDRPSVFEEACDFLIRNRVPYTSWLPMTPFPGTAFYRRLESEGRLKYPKWWLRIAPGMQEQAYNLLYTGSAIDEATYCEGFHSNYRRFHSPLNTLRRVALPPTLRGFVAMAFSLSTWRKINPRTTVIEH